MRRLPDKLLNKGVFSIIWRHKIQILHRNALNYDFGLQRGIFLFKFAVSMAALFVIVEHSFCLFGFGLKLALELH